jgi:hypothetical protein
VSHSPDFGARSRAHETHPPRPPRRRRWAVKGTTGAKLQRYSVDASTWPPRFTKVEFEFEDGTRLALSDPRRLARMHLVADPLADAPISELGPDAHLAMPPLAEFAALLARRTPPIKA